MSREKRTETLREAKRKVGRECGVEYSSGTVRAKASATFPCEGADRKG